MLLMEGKKKNTRGTLSSTPYFGQEKAVSGRKVKCTFSYMTVVESQLPLHITSPGKNFPSVPHASLGIMERMFFEGL